MRKLRAACLPLLGGLLCTLLAPAATAETADTGSKSGSGKPTAVTAKSSKPGQTGAGATQRSGTQRSAKAAKAKQGRKKSVTKRAASHRKPRKKSARRGRRPKPKPRAPGSKPGKPDEGARQVLTGRYPNHSTAPPVESPELKAMRELDNELFPPVPAPVQAPWSTSLRLPTSGPKVSASGLPASGKPATLVKTAPAQDRSWVTKLKKPDFPVRFEPSVVRYLTYYKTTTRGRARVARWVQKSGRYRKAITKLLRQ